jgi:hypothetical protein
MSTRQAFKTALLGVTALVVALITLPALAQEPTTISITGDIVHGTGADDFDPTRIAVTLNILEGVTAFDQQTVTPDATGEFVFTVANISGRAYFIGVEFEGARYSTTLTSDEVGQRVTIQVYPATHDTSVLEFQSYTVIVTGAVPNEGWIEVLERATVFNESGMTLIPDQEAQGPAMLSFLRFALPPDAYNLDVRSNLIGGDILTVDRGFALTTPITPTNGDPHLFEFVYRLDYDGDDLDLSRTMRFGAESFRYVVGADTGRPSSPRLEDLGATELNGKFLRLLEGQDIEPGEVVELHLTELPLPSLLTRARGAAGEWYVRIFGPGAIGVALVLVFAIMAIRRRAVPTLGPNDDPGEVHAILLALAATLEEQSNAGTISERRYQERREEIKQALVDLRVRTREIGAISEYRDTEV